MYWLSACNAITSTSGYGLFHVQYSLFTFRLSAMAGTSGKLTYSWRLCCEVGGRQKIFDSKMKRPPEGGLNDSHYVLETYNQTSGGIVFKLFACFSNF